MSDLLKALLHQQTKPKPPFVLLYGQPGVGKTSMAAAFPDSCIVYCPKECGIEDLKGYGGVSADYPAYKVTNWSQLRDVTAALKTAKHRRVFFDTGDRMLELLQEFILNDKYAGDQKKFDEWGRGNQSCLPQWRQWIDDLLALKDSGIMPAVLCHCVATTVKDPSTDPYRQWVPNIYKSRNDSNSIDLLGPLLDSATEVGFMHFDVLVAEDDKHNMRGQGNKRFIDFQWSPSWTAKSRAGLNRVSMGSTPADAYAAFGNALLAATTKPKE